jgi:UDP-galactopyranose mutase
MNGVRGEDILFISQYHWEDVWRRNQHVATHLAGKRKILYVTPFSAHRLLGGRVEARRLRGAWVGERIYAISVPVLVGENKIPFLRRVNQRYLVSVLENVSRRTGITPGILWFSHPYAEAITEELEGFPVVYDVQDEYPAVPSAPADTSKREIRLLRKADLVFTGTYALFERKRAHSENIHFVSCGVDYEHFHRACDASRAVAKELRHLGGDKTLGYFGEVGDRIDWKLLGEIGRRHPEWDIVLIGGVSRVGPEVEGLPNIHFLGKRGYEELPDYIQGFDVCLIPFKLNDLTRHIHPTKLLEYLSAGKPVISSPIPDVIQFYSDVVGIAGDVESFEEEMKRFEGEADRIRNGLEMARQASWEKAVAEMEVHLESSVSRYGNDRKGRKRNG